MRRQRLCHRLEVHDPHPWPDPGTMAYRCPGRRVAASVVRNHAEPDLSRQRPTQGAES